MLLSAGSSFIRRNVPIICIRGPAISIVNSFINDELSGKKNLAIPPSGYR